MGNVVKNTTKIRLLDLLCPHSCRGCGRLGSVLCGCCKNDIKSRRKRVCPVCKREVAGPCECYTEVIDEVFVGYTREGVVAKLVAEFKYKSVRAIGEVLAELIVPLVESLSSEIIVVPLPTIGKHVRERGLDHTAILARKLARRKGWKMERLLARATDTVQVGAKAEERKKQAETTYEIVGKVDPEAQYLLLDDVWTTGATMRAAARVMRAAGARHIAAVVVETGKK